MRYWIVGWAGACVALGVCAMAMALQPGDFGPRLAGLRVGMDARAADAAAGAMIQKVNPAEWYIRNLSYKGAPADLWVYRDAAADKITGLRWRQDVRYAPPATLRTDLPALSIPSAPNDAGCTKALERLAGHVRPFGYAGPQGSFEARFGEQLTALGFTSTDIAAMLASGQAYAEGFESVEPPSFGCNFIFAAQRQLAGRGYETAVFADVRLDWSQAHQQWRMYRLSLQADVRLTQ
jgi:hypothetical protein